MGVDLSDPVMGTYDEVSIDRVMSAKDFPHVVKSPKVSRESGLRK